MPTMFYVLREHRQPGSRRVRLRRPSRQAATLRAPRPGQIAGFARDAGFLWKSLPSIPAPH